MTITDTDAPAPKIYVVIASMGRPKTLVTALRQLNRQTLKPAGVVLSMEKESDSPGPHLDLSGLGYEVITIYGPRGSCVQRNRGIDRVIDRADMIAFLDDDYLPSRYAFEGMARFFAAYPEVDGITGHLLADGATGAGYSGEQALDMVAEADKSYTPVPPDIVRFQDGLYGCNMVYRSRAIGSTRFGEDLPLYAWLEDLDFGARMQAKQAKTNAFYGVHCSEKSGREKSGVRLGYSQICNPLYLMTRGRLNHRTGTRQPLQNFLANHAKMFRPEPWIDRKGRAKGNWIAIMDLLRGRLNPSRILDL